MDQFFGNVFSQTLSVLMFLIYINLFRLKIALYEHVILKEMRSNKSASTVTNPRSEMDGIRNMQPSGSKTNKSIGVHASFNENIDSEDEDYPLQASKMRDLRHPAKPFHRSETNLDRTLVSDEDSEVEDYHNTMETLKLGRTNIN